MAKQAPVSARDGADMLAIVGATVIDGTGRAPVVDGVVLIAGGRIVEVGRSVTVPTRAKRIDARGRYVIPGLMNANVHLLMDIRLENLAHYRGRYEELIVEAAQIALKNGLTTVFDTYGPRRHLMAVRERINARHVAGSRVFCAGNIVGFDGPFSPDFSVKAAEIASVSFARRINATWVENVGRHLMWLTPEQVAREVRSYIGRGIDFVKFGSNEHFGSSAGAFLAFSPQAQSAIVDEAHRAGLTAQAHTQSVEGLRVAIEAGCNLVQHANITGPVIIPATTLEAMARRQTGAVVFPLMRRRLQEMLASATDQQRTMWGAAEKNVLNLIASETSLLLGTDGSLFAPEAASDPWISKSWMAPGEDNLSDLAAGHFVWLRAMEEKGCRPMGMLRAATANIAAAYRKDDDLGTLEPRKLADLLILDRDPLAAAENYRSIHMIVKEGEIVDRDALPNTPLLSAPLEPLPEEDVNYVPFFNSSTTAFPMCPCCIGR